MQNDNKNQPSSPIAPPPPPPIPPQAPYSAPPTQGYDTASAPQAPPQSSQATVYTTPKHFIFAALIGLVVGAIAWGIMMLLDRFVITPLFCDNIENFTVCANSTRLSAHSATILAALAGMFGLLAAGIVRPLLIAGAAAVALWGAQAWIQSSWWESLLATVVLYGLLYLALFWLSRFKKALVAIILVVILVVLTKLPLML